MKRMRLIIAAATLFAGVALSAQVRYGIMGGATFSTGKFSEISTRTLTSFHAGLTLKVGLPVGFSIQPSLIYNVKGADMSDVSSVFPTFKSVDLSMGFVELPVSFQWGPDLLLFRPFVDVTPFVGYAVNSKLVSTSLDGTAVTEKNSWNLLNRFEYGVGLGFGVEIWRIQVLARYNWNFGSLCKFAEETDAGFGQVMKAAYDKRSFGGVTLSVAVLFGGGKKSRNK